MKSWKTTLGGILSAVGVLLTGSPDPRLQKAGIAAAAIGSLILGGSARDNDKTSEETGAKQAETRRVYGNP